MDPLSAALTPARAHPLCHPVLPLTRKAHPAVLLRRLLHTSHGVSGWVTLIPSHHGSICTTAGQWLCK
uniref:Uncharacterized protein n=1 Tax=Anguilla anguilla TaxID=7936 RepID=A0A0E9RBE6_ANGAN